MYEHFWQLNLLYGTEDTTVPSTVVTVVGVLVLLEEVTVAVLELVAVEGPVTEVAVEGTDVKKNKSNRN